MNEAELKRWVRSEIARQVAAIQFGSSLDADGQTETIESLYPGSPGIPKRPVMMPFGFASRAVAKVIQVVGKIGSDPSNRMVLGHRHGSRPELKNGESSVYSTDETAKVAYQLKAMIDGIRVVSPGGKEQPLLLGSDVITVLSKLLDLLIAHTHGPPGTAPSNIADFQSLKQEDLAGSTLLSTKDGGFE